jgi:hypothetical protein
VLDGDCQVATDEFRKVIETLPAKFQVTIVEAFETDASALVIIRMDYFSLATFSATIDFEVSSRTCWVSDIRNGKTILFVTWE